MRAFTPLLGLAMLAAAPVLAQEAPDAPGANPGPGIAVQRVTLRPGDVAVFTLKPGGHHQLLVAAKRDAPGAISISYDQSGDRITAVSHAGKPMSFSVLADPSHSGGFVPMGDIPLPGDGSTVVKDYPRPLGTINVGDFVGGPTGIATGER